MTASPQTKCLTAVNSNKNSWLANLLLEFSMTLNGTQLTRTERNGPLSVQKAFYPEGRDCAHIYLLHPPAGIVSGDELRINIKVNQQAHSLVTTPGANRFYRAREDLSIGDSKQVQHCELLLAEHAKCENFPLETIVYEGADGVNTVDVHLTSNSVYLGWDITCLGLPRSGQLFEQGRYSQLNRVYCDNTLLYHDRIAIKPDNQIHQHVAGLNNKSVFATFMAYTEKGLLSDTENKALIAKLRNCISESQADEKVSISQIRQLLVIRYLGQHAEECKALFIKLWQIIRPIYLNKPANMPRVWHT
ncbi:MAG: urease accessory protein UreD [Colwellia polaris]|jgi:urease accessory protein|uniref:urease accessory protein UreD n=1 Tax=Colwellia polaris TaxID=326537 RepID=UPI000A174CD9|nr:urease accessory protein UreD [Colwellia polaris]|tara:strand:- start:20432 stop:21343 length:912 start_codon:yes stop_codon:yes gene_type:complete